MEFGGRSVRPELTWARHVKSAPEWLKPYLDVPDNAAAPLAMTPVHPEAVGSLGPEAIAWVKTETGVDLRWWQQLAFVRDLEVRADGSLCWQTVVESGTRRIGKSVRLRSKALWRLTHADIFGEPQLIVHTGKDLAIVREIIRGAWAYADGHDWRVVRALTRETIENDEHRWLAKASDAVYGYDMTSPMVDEGWAIDPTAVSEGMEPAMLERKSPQLLLTSTAHRKATSLMRSYISDGLAIDNGSTLLLLWGAADGSDSSSPATWRSASAYWSEDRHQLMRSKHEKAMRGEQDAELDDPDPMKGFESQYLNRWLLKAGAGGALPGWDGLKVDQAPPAAESLGVAADATGSWFSLAAYGADFVAPVARARAEQGRGTFLTKVVEVARRNELPVVIRTKGMAGTLIDDLKKEGVRVIEASFDDFVQASADFFDAVQTAEVGHGAMPELDAAVMASRWRDVNGRRVLETRGADSSMLESAVLARWNAKSHTSVYEKRGLLTV